MSAAASSRRPGCRCSTRTSPLRRTCSTAPRRCSSSGFSCRCRSSRIPTGAPRRTPARSSGRWRSPLGVGIVINRWRGRPWNSMPRHVGKTELAVFVLVPALLVLAADFQARDAIETALLNLALLLLIYAVLAYGLVSIVNWIGRRLWRQLMASFMLLARAVPLLMIFALLAFMSDEMWQVFSRISYPDLAVVGLLFVGLGTAFLFARLPKEVRLLEAEVGTEADAARQAPAPQRRRRPVHEPGGPGPHRQPAGRRLLRRLRRDRGQRAGPAGLGRRDAATFTLDRPASRSRSPRSCSRSPAGSPPSPASTSRSRCSPTRPTARSSSTRSRQSCDSSGRESISRCARSTSARIRPMRTDRPGWSRASSTSPGTTAARPRCATCSRFHGTDVTEELAFGLGAGPCFYYFADDALSPTRFTNGRTGRLEENFLELTGAPLRLRTADDPRGVLGAGPRDRRRGPAGAAPDTDLFYLDHYGNSAHFPGHAVVLAGYDEESAYVSDTAFEGLQRTSLEGLALARHEQHPFYPLAGHMVDLPPGAPSRRPAGGRAARRSRSGPADARAGAGRVRGPAGAAAVRAPRSATGPPTLPTGSGRPASTTR